MVEKIAVPFWLCWSAGMIVGLVTGQLRLWLAIGAGVGIVLGLIMRAIAKWNRQLSFHGRMQPSSSAARDTAVSAPEAKRAA